MILKIWWEKKETHIHKLNGTNKLLFLKKNQLKKKKGVSNFFAKNIIKSRLNHRYMVITWLFLYRRMYEDLSSFQGKIIRSHNYSERRKNNKLMTKTSFMSLNQNLYPVRSQLLWSSRVIFRVVYKLDFIITHLLSFKNGWKSGEVVCICLCWCSHIHFSNAWLIPASSYFQSRYSAPEAKSQNHKDKDQTQLEGTLKDYLVQSSWERQSWWDCPA